MRVREFQELIWEIYKHHDKRRGLDYTIKWFLTEIYEFIKAVEEENRDGIKEEAADVLAWFASIGNLLGIDLEDAIIDRYGNGCPKCGSIPCKCMYREKPDKNISIISL